MSQYENLFRELKIGSKVMKNRIMLSPMGDTMANYDGSLSPQAMAYYTEKARGGVAVVQMGVMNVDYPGGKTGDVKNRIDSPKVVKDLRRLAENVQRHGALLIPQLSHAGPKTTPTGTEGLPITCVSEKEPLYNPKTCKIPTTEEVKGLVQKFVNAAYYAKLAGCDGASLHSAHGYLINQFLSPSSNARTDEYGGSFENRMRFPLEIVKGIREKCGPDFIVGARIPGIEHIENGITEDECVEFAKRMEEAGCDYLDVSVGMSPIRSHTLETEYYEQGAKVKYGAKIRKAVRVPLGINGNLRDPEFCDALIKDGKYDFVMLARPLICDPYWPRKVYEGREDRIRPCLNCIDGCMNRVLQGYNVSCVLNPVAGREMELADLRKAENPRHVAVVGGGLAGMQAAITAAQIGHKVTLLEKSDRLGGQMNLACVPPHKEKIEQARKWFIAEVQRQGVAVKLNTESDFEMIRALGADAVIVAAGAAPVLSIPVPGCANTVQAWDVLAGKVAVTDKKRAVIIGGGIVGCEIAQMLIPMGKEVTIIEMLPKIAPGLELYHYADLIREFEASGVQVHVNAAAKEITCDTVTFVKDGKEIAVPSDMTVLAVGQKPQGGELIRRLKEERYRYIVIGDAKKPAKFINATVDGFFAALDI